MTVYDLAFLLMFFAAIVILLTAGILTHFGHKRAARFMFRGLVGGALAQNIGIRATLAVAVIGVALSTVWLIASPLRKLREIPS